MRNKLWFDDIFIWKTRQDPSEMKTKCMRANVLNCMIRKAAAAWFHHLACWYSTSRTRVHTQRHTHTQTRLIYRVFSRSITDNISGSIEVASAPWTKYMSETFSRRTRASRITFHWKLNSLKLFSKHGLSHMHTQTHTEFKGRLSTKYCIVVSIYISPMYIYASWLSVCLCVFIYFRPVLRARAVT